MVKVREVEVRNRVGGKEEVEKVIVRGDKNGMVQKEES